MFELLFLLLPVAAAYGWYMGNRSAQQDKQQEADRLSRKYVTGVNFLLSNQRDKAVEHFVDMLKEDSTAFEAHLTLGNLFRSRGEIEKATGIHQSLIESSALSFEQKLLATQQLGRDYVAAGFYDRAENIFLQLVKEKEFKISSLQQLLLLYQGSSDWLKAINIAEELTKLGKKELKTEIAHFYCELALQAIGRDDLVKATSMLKKAFQADKKCARASYMQGQLWMNQKQYTKAIHEFEKILLQDKGLLSEVLPALKQCYQQVGNNKKWTEFVQRCVDINAGVTADLMMADIIEEKSGREAAQIYIYKQLQRYPTLKGFHRLMNYHLNDAEEGRAKESLSLLRNMVGEQIRTKPHYRCQKCGFTAYSLHWHCPSCRSWATVKPVIGLDGQ